MATQKLNFDTNCSGLAPMNRTLLPYTLGCGPAFDHTASREAKIANKIGSFVWRRGIELGLFPYGMPTTMQSKSLPLREKSVLNAYEAHI